MLKDISYLPCYDTRSIPFLVVLADGKKALLNFDCKIRKCDDGCALAHIFEIRVCDEDLHLKLLYPDSDVSAKYGIDEQYSFEQYWKGLESVYSDFSSNEMDALMQNCSSKILFEAYKIAGKYVQTHYTHP